MYGGGTSEEFLGQLNWQDRGIIMDTKIAPTVVARISVASGNWTHRPEHLRENLKQSLKALKTDKVDLWYLHRPDRTTPYEDTLRGVNDLYKEGYFRRFGISNYPAWEVARICELCNQNGWMKPVVYQGVYNAIHRSVEPELFPCLRHYGIAFYAYNPLAGGYLTDRYKRETTDVEEGSRFDPNRTQGRNYRQRYWNDACFDALDTIRPVVKESELTEAEAALRWMTHHSLLKREHGDAIIIGASSTKHLEENMVDLEKGPLPDEVLKALDKAWDITRGVQTRYYR